MIAPVELCRNISKLLQKQHPNAQDLARDLLIREVYDFIYVNKFGVQSLDDIAHYASEFLDSISKDLSDEQIRALKGLVDNKFRLLVLFWDYQKGGLYFPKGDFLEKIGQFKEVISPNLAHFHQSCLLIAAALGFDNVVHKILQINTVNSCDILEDESFAPIHIATYYNQSDVIITLLQHWGKSRVLQKAIQQKSKDGKSALDYAIIHRSLEVARLLLDNGATENLVQGADFIYRKALQPNSDIESEQKIKQVAWEFLNDLNVDFNQSGIQGDNIIHLAANNACFKVIANWAKASDEEREFIGVDFNSKDIEGFSVMERFLQGCAAEDLSGFIEELKQHDPLLLLKLLDSSFSNNFLLSAKCTDAILKFMNEVVNGFSNSFSDDEAYSFDMKSINYLRRISNKICELGNLKISHNLLKEYFNQKLQDIEFNNQISEERALLLFLKCKSAFIDLILVIHRECEVEEAPEMMLQLEEKILALENCITQSDSVSDIRKQNFNLEFTYIKNILEEEKLKSLMTREEVREQPAAFPSEADAVELLVSRVFQR